MADDRDFFDSVPSQAGELRSPMIAPINWRPAAILAVMIVFGIGCLVGPLLLGLGWRP